MSHYPRRGFLREGTDGESLERQSLFRLLRLDTESECKESLQAYFRIDCLIAFTCGTERSETAVHREQRNYRQHLPITVATRLRSEQDPVSEQSDGKGQARWADFVKHCYPRCRARARLRVNTRANPMKLIILLKL